MNQFSMLLLSNTLIALVLAVCAWACSRCRINPIITHTLWVALLVKLVSLPVVQIPILSPLPTAAPIVVASRVDSIELASRITSTSTTETTWLHESVHASLSATWLWLIVWLAGSFFCVTRLLAYWWRGARVVRQAVDETAKNAERLATQIGLRRAPRIVITDAVVAPFVWCCFCRPVVVIPAKLLDAEGRLSCDAVLLHEFAHVRRWDHVVRHLEWLTTCLLWWHPFVWIAKHQIRQVEELCCDEYVLRHLPASRYKYAHALVDVAELVSPLNGAAALHCGMSPRTLLTRRVEMMLHGSVRNLRGRRALLSVVLICLPISFTFAAPPDKKKTVKASPAPRRQPGKSPTIRAPLDKELAVVRAVFFEANKDQLAKLGLSASSAGRIGIHNTDKWRKAFRQVQDKIQVLSRPRLATLLGQSARIVIGQEIETIGPNRGKKSRPKISAGIQTGITAKRDKDGKIQLNLAIRITDVKTKRTKRLGTQIVTERNLHTTAKVVGKAETLVVQLPTTQAGDKYVVAAFTTLILKPGEKLKLAVGRNK